VQTDLANTLEAIAKGGTDAFYKGKIPQAVEAAAKQGGGILTAADFANYKVTETRRLPAAIAATSSCRHRLPAPAA
jgi:Gamma-glutamyltransferase